MSTLKVPLTNFHNNGCENWFLTTLLKNILVQYKELDVVLISSGTVIVHKKSLQVHLYLYFPVFSSAQVDIMCGISQMLSNNYFGTLLY